MSKFTPEQIQDIRGREKYYGLIRDLMLEFKVSRKTVQNILHDSAYKNC